MTETELGMQRFENWRRYMLGGEAAMILSHHYERYAAVCGQHISSEVWEVETRIPVDPKDAEVVERYIVKSLPLHLSRAVRNYYIGRPKIVGIPGKVLREWVEAAARELMCKRFHETLVLVDKKVIDSEEKTI